MDVRQVPRTQNIVNMVESTLEEKPFFIVWFIIYILERIQPGQIPCLKKKKKK